MPSKSKPKTRNNEKTVNKNRSSQASNNKPPLVVILGPTAAGKTGFAIRLAQQVNGEIVSADSRLLYRGMDIGTAKPSLEERALVMHYLIDVADPDQPWSLTQFKRNAQEAIQSIHSREKLPILVGGTGQYIRAIVQDWRVPEVKPDTRLRSVLNNWAEEIGREQLHSRLAVLDTQAAEKIDPRNLRRTVRAMEVIFHSGKRFSAQRQKGDPIYQLVQIGLIMPRRELYERIDLRIDQMFAAGFIDEVRALLAEGYAPDLPPFSAIGYREVIDYLLSEITLDEAHSQIKRRTRLLVRRQANWFKEDNPDIHWFDSREDPLEEVETLLRCKLPLD